jgi:3-methylfumaryl-CoA hydratase
VSVNFDAWVGREEKRSERIVPSVAEQMAATLAQPLKGKALPPGWQWLFFNPVVPRTELGVDGHPKRGGFLPPIDLPRRMWAGSRIRYLAPLPIGSVATRRSRIQKIESKSGKRGALTFVTLEHVTHCNEVTCIWEEQDIVYREATPIGQTSAPTPQPHEETAQWSRSVTPDTTLLFRYSALTFNGHRIHYDQSYARDEEGYPDLVVHGPLTATMLQQFAVEQDAGRVLAAFEFRGVTPLFVSQPFQLEGRRLDDHTLSMWARGPHGELAMSATARFR